jgi:hypothetical protein
MLRAGKTSQAQHASNAPGDGRRKTSHNFRAAPHKIASRRSRPDGTLIGPVMPIALYRGLSDHDLMAMVAYLRAVPPVQHAVTERSTYPFPLTPYGPPVAGVPDPPEDDPVARGAYLAGPLAHCMDCHTPPLPAERRDWSRIGAGGVPFEVPVQYCAPRQMHYRGARTS